MAVPSSQTKSVSLVQTPLLLWVSISPLSNGDNHSAQLFVSPRLTKSTKSKAVKGLLKQEGPSLDVKSDFQMVRALGREVRMGDKGRRSIHAPFQKKKERERDPFSIGWRRPAGRGGTR